VSSFRNIATSKTGRSKQAICFPDSNVSDQAVNVLWVGNLSGSAGFAVDVSPVPTPEEAAERMAHAGSPYDAVVVPVAAGRAGVERVRQVREAVPAAPLVALLDVVDRDTVAAVLQAGADDYVPADAGREALAAAVRTAATRRRREQEREAVTLRVLYGGAPPDDADAVRAHMQARAPHMRLTFVPGVRDAAGEMRRSGWDAVLLDERGGGVEALELLRDLPDTSVVLVVAPGSEALAVGALRLGAAGYVVRNPGWLHQVPVEVECAFTRRTLRRQLAADLEREKVLQLAFDSLSSRLLVLDRDGVVTYASRSWREMAGACSTPLCAPMPGENYLEACRSAAPCDEDAFRAGEGMAAVLQGRTDRFEMEYRCDAPGGPQWYLLQATPMLLEYGGVVVCHVNVTERRRMEEALRESHERYALATAAGAVGVWDWNLETGEMFVDPALKALLGYADHEIPNRVEAWGRHTHPDDMAGAWDAVNGYLEGRLPRLEHEHRMLHRDGSMRWFLARGGGERRPDGTIYRLVGTDADVTERRVVEQELLQSRAELRRLAGRLVAAQDEERRRIARELHDDLIQRVAALGIGISGLTGAPLAEVRLRTASLHARVEHLADGIRTLSHRMHSAVLEHAGLVPALDSLCQEFGRLEGLAAEFHTEGADAGLPPELAGALYRIAQEGLRNVVRHAAVRTARVTLSQADGSVGLVVADAGRGFDPAAVGAEGLGLVSMAERARLLGGTFEVRSAPGAGTELRTRIPLPPEEDGDPAKTFAIPPPDPPSGREPESPSP
jgi:two-component system, NarL family, sensor histidine kinase UhpB